ncbi:uncharacterized protein LOC113204184 [Frankliniella occidentalis]|uniref:Uncharacterized protein LOC113204184 n=1 Tax=Frankliniella occidentalis TaxID=133901 RepID=A0A9C6UDD5_FRAOC|nr:uncharacterized protein LOC113204184 [Frankliniella occidentalis]
MEVLPDDVWLMVLEKLEEAADVLACRLVCKRLAALAVHPAVWRHLEVGQSKPYCSCPVLRLAPCLDSISVHLPAKGCTQWAFASTRCAAAKLYIPIKGRSHAGLAAAIICKQEMLGRLTDVEIEMRSVAVTDVPILLGTLASTSRLTRICVYVYLGGNQLPNTPAPILGGTAVTPSLREFECNLSPLTEPFVKSILSQHATTLEDVLLDFPLSSLTCTSTALILAGVTNLRMLVCDCFPGMESLVACKSLKVLALTVNTESHYRPAVAGLAKLLRGAEQLRKVNLTYKPAVRSPTDLGGELVLALASSGRSCVETLHITNRCYPFFSVEYTPLPELVASALPSLPALRHLNLQDNAKRPDALLLAIRPDVSAQPPSYWHITE